ncbi:MAG: helix-turn-helix transcriptional regulator [Ruminococcaceae bacterium]|nr:helix-turn-helix transcriptional regulator [Oscillospiraceae bacterium]
MKRIAELRKEKGLNQVGLALKLNVSQKMISAYESGIHQPSVETLSKLADIFNVSVDYIIGRTDIRLSADKYTLNGLTDVEVELLDMFRTMSKEKQQRTLGIVYAMGYSDSDKR